MSRIKELQEELLKVSDMTIVFYRCIECNLLTTSLQAKVIVVDDNMKIVYEDHVSYDVDLPEFG